MSIQNDEIESYAEEAEEEDEEEKEELPKIDSPQNVEEEELLNEEVLSISILQTDPMIFNRFCVHPCVRVHIIDETTFQHLEKSDPSRPVLKKDEFATDLDFKPNFARFINPFLTKVVNFGTRNFAVWNQTFIVNDLFNHLVSDNVIYIFEIVEFNRPSIEAINIGWYPISWGYLRGRSISKHKPGTTFRIPLYKLPKDFKEKNPLTYWPSAPPAFPFGLALYARMLGVTVKTPTIESPPHSGEMASYAHSIQRFSGNQRRLKQEKSPVMSSLFVKFDKSGPVEFNEDVMEVQALQVEAQNDELKQQQALKDAFNDLKQSQLAFFGQYETILTRRRMEKRWCRLPNTLCCSVPTGEEGCSLVKFDSQGQFIACACGTTRSCFMRVCHVHSLGLSHLTAVHLLPIVDLIGHKSIIYQLAWSNDSRFLLSASADFTVCVYDMVDDGTEGRAQQRLQEAENGIVEFGLRERVLVQKGQNMHQLISTFNKNQISFTNNHTPFFPVTYPTPLQKQNPKQFFSFLSPRLVLRHPSFVYSVCIHPEFAGLTDQQAKDCVVTEATEEIHRFPLLVCTSCFDGVIRVWAITTGAHSDWHSDIPRKHMVKEENRESELNGGHLLAELRAHNTHVDKLVFDTTGEMMFSSDGNGVVVGWVSSKTDILNELDNVLTNNEATGTEMNRIDALSLAVEKVFRPIQVVSRGRETLHPSLDDLDLFEIDGDDEAFLGRVQLTHSVSTLSHYPPNAKLSSQFTHSNLLVVPQNSAPFTSAVQTSLTSPYTESSLVSPAKNRNTVMRCGCFTSDGQAVLCGGSDGQVYVLKSPTSEFDVEWNMLVSQTKQAQNRRKMVEDWKKMNPDAQIKIDGSDADNSEMKQAELIERMTKKTEQAVVFSSRGVLPVGYPSNVASVDWHPLENIIAVSTLNPQQPVLIFARLGDVGKVAEKKVEKPIELKEPEKERVVVDENAFDVIGKMFQPVHQRALQTIGEGDETTEDKLRGDLRSARKGDKDEGETERDTKRESDLRKREEALRKREEDERRKLEDERKRLEDERKRLEDEKKKREEDERQRLEDEERKREEDRQHTEKRSESEDERPSPLPAPTAKVEQKPPRKPRRAPRNEADAFDVFPLRSDEDLPFGAEKGRVTSESQFPFAVEYGVSDGQTIRWDSPEKPRRKARAEDDRFAVVSVSAEHPTVHPPQRQSVPAGRGRIESERAGTPPLPAEIDQIQQRKREQRRQRQSSSPSKSMSQASSVFTDTVDTPLFHSRMVSQPHASQTPIDNRIIIPTSAPPARPFEGIRSESSVYVVPQRGTGTIHTEPVSDDTLAQMEMRQTRKHRNRKAVEPELDTSSSFVQPTYQTPARSPVMTITQDPIVTPQMPRRPHRTAVQMIESDIDTPQRSSPHPQRPERTVQFSNSRRSTTPHQNRSSPVVAREDDFYPTSSISHNSGFTVSQQSHHSPPFRTLSDALSPPPPTTTFVQTDYGSPQAPPMRQRRAVVPTLGDIENEDDLNDTMITQRERNRREHQRRKGRRTRQPVMPDADHDF
ncbi:hypothetical protein BLNAU_765 [Blattamonas nauphoetae]|uniref:Uncharacterized protein n=1 Tax=Blattamonas nauphoetae TaxID=2049346 RepID=A0ABQ9YKZ9_9EUKA|nr:hypothetical protein BLNAU_765 [Blattamonas nauphoetae]